MEEPEIILLPKELPTNANLGMKKVMEWGPFSKKIPKKVSFF